MCAPLLLKNQQLLFPDLVMVKGEPPFQEDTFDNLLNPYLIIEILFKSTSGFDKGDKFSAYRSIDSLETTSRFPLPL
ncbi:Uma2 family endonuclease [Catalinimonas locisalis]|uniref:Uma2 family endonuclease n=1 Tax=Catalinimonas locisalis TaxID=3133978 RepID=UPI00403F1CC2